MNQTINGFVLLGSVILIGVVLYVLASVLKPKQNDHKPKPLLKSTKKSIFKSKSGSYNGDNNKQMYKLQKLIIQHFKGFDAKIRQHYLILERDSIKVAMLTIDKKVDIGRRRLGEVDIINFHKLPSVEELKIELSGV